MDGIDECKALLNSINSAVSRIETKVDNLTTTVSDIGEIVVQTTEFLQQDILNKTLLPIEEGINTLGQHNKVLKDCINVVSEENQALDIKIKESSQVSLATFKTLKDVQKQKSILPDDVLVTLKNCEEVLKVVNRVYLGGT